jgi:hypothetical protein
MSTLNLPTTVAERDTFLATIHRARVNTIGLALDLPSDSALSTEDLREVFEIIGFDDLEQMATRYAEMAANDPARMSRRIYGAGPRG